MLLHEDTSPIFFFLSDPLNFRLSSLLGNSSNLVGLVLVMRSIVLAPLAFPAELLLKTLHFILMLRAQLFQLLVVPTWSKSLLGYAIVFGFTGKLFKMRVWMFFRISTLSNLVS